jgi:hypothetical protein
MKNIKDILLFAWDWLVKSSADKAKLSLTIKGAISTAVVVLGYLGVTGHGIDSAAAGDSMADLAVSIVALYTVGVTVFGAARKVWITIVKPLLEWLGILNKPE